MATLDASTDHPLALTAAPSDAPAEIKDRLDEMMVGYVAPRALYYPLITRSDITFVESAAQIDHNE